ncbi:ornithine carbamoyltransferase [Candidatus Pseudothioglobus singularis]|jgi:ornithine carbamoyltransferase|uniref:ornithine carbamoyltransferase n=1 Tax=Candidatus Pseudothioglobus singularis TaxID=1427364 RepID=UPI00035C185A|nr:ornithine carbamoyltransferase [Candidatus Pseudothioglobus singularis]ANQ66411.1 ornithine carbamoyltransferase [Candidatus Pseudothioglobus singularis]MDG1166658.1 ornithine carbamoyltransferase [Candidatus Thioglobus sp.]MDG1344801.1 ornithine carbamoyltransferase [Candidatus Thioglobus sp.]MDG1956385.1 ornithine carbamoyltransferase [Candidatus Thioglobus sp.]|tara:strand:+ start:787 stop:1689 length:903 start_codon:yes stop_codon:yes gene_type:complete
MIKHFINFDDLSLKELQGIIDQAISLKKEHKSGQINDTLKNKTLAMIFDKSSTRTRVSFEAGMTQLGGQSLFLSEKDIQLGRGEPITDSAIVISSMVDAVMLRLSSHEDIIEFSKHSSKPVINALSDESHPCQILADLMTYQEMNGSIKNKKIAWIGDGCNVCQTYMQAAGIFDFELSIATPKGYEPSELFIENYKKNINFYSDPLMACENADIIVTDVWTSMGQESEKKQRELAFTGFQVDQNMMNQAKKDAIFMHCLPAYREKEVSSEVIDGNQSVVWSEAENRLHVQKSLLLYLIEN